MPGDDVGLGEPARLLEQAHDLRTKGQEEAARRLIAEALSRFPDDARLLLHASLDERGRDDAAALDLVRKAVEAGRQDVTVLVIGAGQLFDLGDVDQAQAIVTGLEDRLEETGPLADRLLYVTSQIAAARGQLELAEQGLRLGFSTQPENPEWGFVLASVLLKQDRDEEALEVVLEARQHRPDAEPLADLEAKIRAWLMKKRDTG